MQNKKLHKCHNRNKRKDLNKDLNKNNYKKKFQKLPQLTVLHKSSKIKFNKKMKEKFLLLNKQNKYRGKVSLNSISTYQRSKDFLRSHNYQRNQLDS